MFVILEARGEGRQFHHPGPRTSSRSLQRLTSFWTSCPLLGEGSFSAKQSIVQGQGTQPQFSHRRHAADGPLGDPDHVELPGELHSDVCRGISNMHVTKAHQKTPTLYADMTSGRWLNHLESQSLKRYLSPFPYRVKTSDGSRLSYNVYGTALPACFHILSPSLSGGGATSPSTLQRSRGVS